MIQRIIILTTILVWHLCLNGQSRFVSLAQKLKSADSVLIVSHEATAGIVIVDEETGIKHEPPELVKNGQANRSIIRESRVLSDTALQQLSRILLRPFDDTEIEIGKCFIPHHGILIYNNRAISFIDMCFPCKGISTSKDIHLTIRDFDDRKWDDLIAFFKSTGFKYELHLEKTSEEQ
jgi:hypothetical protein